MRIDGDVRNSVGRVKTMRLGNLRQSSAARTLGLKVDFSYRCRYALRSKLCHVMNYNHIAASTDSRHLQIAGSSCVQTKCSYSYESNLSTPLLELPITSACNNNKLWLDVPGLWPRDNRDAYKSDKSETASRAFAVLYIRSGCERLVGPSHTLQRRRSV